MSGPYTYVLRSRLRGSVSAGIPAEMRDASTQGGGMCWGKSEELTFLKGRVTDEEKMQPESLPTWPEPKEEPEKTRDDEREKVLEPV